MKRTSVSSNTNAGGSNASKQSHAQADTTTSGTMNKKSASYAQDKGSLSWSLGLLAEIFLGYASWSLFTDFLPIIWYFPLNYMDFTGWEAFLGVLFSPLLLASHGVRRLVYRYYSQLRTLALFIGVFGLHPFDLTSAVYLLWFFPSTLAAKLTYLSFGVSLDLLCMCRTWWSTNQEHRDRALWGYLIGLLLSLVVRLEYASINPSLVWVWPNIITLAAVLWAGVFLTREGGVNMKEELEHRRETAHAAHPAPLRVATGFGALLFLMQWLLSEHGVVPRWLDLNPFPYGVFIIVGCALGLLLSQRNELTRSTYWLGFGILGAFLLTIGGSGDGGVLSFIGLAGGVILAIYGMSIWHATIDDVARVERPGRVFAWAIVVYLFLVIWSIWIVAYKFVPWYLGSTLLRERHKSLTVATVLLCGMGHVLSYSGGAATVLKRVSAQWPRREVVTMLMLVLVVLGLPITMHRAIQHPTAASIAATHLTTTPHEIKGMIWTIHFGYDNFGRNNFEAVAAVIKEQKANVVGLLETDLSRLFMNNMDLAEWLERDLQMYSDFGPSTAENTWGCVLLSAFPIEQSNRIVLPSPEGELACLIDAVIRVNNVPVNILVTHFGNTEDELDRKLQALEVAKLVREKNMPTVFLGYVTDKPGGPNYNQLVQSGLVDTTNQKRYCQYVFYKDLNMKEFYRWDSGDISDTEAQIGVFQTK